MNDIPFHPLSEIFPLIEGADFDALRDDIAKNGVLEPIVLMDGQIIDGRNRYLAALAADVECPTTIYEGNDPLGLVISLNLKRRHLSESQRAMVASALANMKSGERTDLPSIEGRSISQGDAAKLLNVGVASVERAANVRANGTAELISAVQQGRLAVSEAAKMSKAAPEVQRAIVAKVNAGVKPMEAARQVTAAVKAERRVALPDGKYRILYADPPWSYGNTQPDYHTEQRDHYTIKTFYLSLEFVKNHAIKCLDAT